MYKLMIVDDEQIVLDGLKFLVEDTMDDIEVVACASSGREAILACDRYNPDIVFMDIQMPGINGIEAIESIKKRHRDIRFVIISAYEQFEYAKQAVELGVSEYILKPINPEKLTEVLRRLSSELEAEWNHRMREIENKEKLEKIIPVLEHGFIYSLLMNTDYRDELSKYKGLFEVDMDRAYIMVIEFGEGKHPELQNRIGTGIKGQSFYPKVQNIIKYKCKSIVGPLIINRMTVLVYEGQLESEYEQRVRAFELANNIYEKIDEVVDCNVYISVGSCYPLEKSRNSLEEALFGLNRITDENIVHYKDISETESDEDEYTYIDIKEDESHIIKLLESGQKDSLVNELKAFFNRIDKKFHGDIGNLRNTMLELMVMVFSSSFRNELQDEAVGYSNYINELNRLDSNEALKNWCLRKITYISEQIQGKKGKHISNVVLHAKKYIDEHIREEISLNDISKMVSVSPQYFSKIFKDEIGLSFVEYYRVQRIEIAKELLKTNKYSVKEICYQVGYNDPNYFSRLFKRLVGVSPTEYK